MSANMVSKRKECEPATLECLGECKGFTEHVYEGMRKVEVKNDPTGTYEEVYRCSGCGALRRWGMISGSWRGGRLANCPGLVPTCADVRRPAKGPDLWEW